MYNIRQFKPTLYILLILGMTAYALAAESPGLWVLGVGAVLLNAWLIRIKWFTPMPRLVANLVTLGALAYALLQVRSHVTPVLAVGVFLVLLQIIKLFEQRYNRDYAQLLVLSLLLMVAASINTASLLFGIMLIVYLFLSLYCCLLFHLKVETDHAKQVLGLRDEQRNPATLRQDQRFLSRSMRRLTMVVAFVSVGCAVIVFLFFPRGAGANFIGPLQFKAVQRMTGMSEQVSFQQLARISQNTEVVGHIWVWHNGQLIQGTQELMLRGSTLDIYTGNDRKNGSWRWVHGRGESEPPVERIAAQTPLMLPRGKIHAPSVDNWRQRFLLEPTDTRLIFGLAGLSEFTPLSEALGVRYEEPDETLHSVEPIRHRLEYEILSRGKLLEPDFKALANEPIRSRIDPKIAEFARKPEVSGHNAAGALAKQRDPKALVTPLDAEIAKNISEYLRKNFSYTLDLTDAKRIQGEDPIVAFLYRLRRGHCEYFAGAMTLMCQSLGIHARMVIGFACNEYNRVGGFYVVRQSQAHAWVEVLTPQGWQMFDPTSGRQAQGNGQAGAWRQFKQLFDYIEFTWANSVVAYDQDNRQNLITGLETKLTTTAANSHQAVQQAYSWFGTAQSWFLSSYLLAGILILMAVGIFGAVLWFAWERFRLRRRVAHLGLKGLSVSDQMRLLRQLGFYDDMTRLLARHRIIRPRHLTPLEFSNSLAYLPTEAFDLVRELTRIFYRIRFGRSQLKPAQQRRLLVAMEQLAEVLPADAPAR
jgi:transglutaminase-like putative cysteine protease